MKMSVREARARFAAAVSAAERGERVTITKNGKPVAEIGPPAETGAAETGEEFWARLERIRSELHLDKLPRDSRSDERQIADHRACRREMLGSDRFGDDMLDSR